MEQLSQGRLCPKCGEPQEWAATFARPQWICRPCRAAATKRSQERHKERIRERSKAWYRDNKPRHKDLVARWNAEVLTPEMQAEYDRRSYQKHRAKRLEKTRRWRQENPEAHDAQKARRRARLKGARVEPTPQAAISSRLALWGGECAYCGEPGCEQDHFVPISEGGAHAVSNIVSCCRSCNASKGTKDAFAWYSAQPFFSEARWGKLLQIVLGDRADANEVGTTAS